MILRSLRARLLLTFVLVVLIAIGAVTLFTRQTALNAFQNVVDRQATSNQQLIARIIDTSRQPGGTADLQRLVEQAARETRARILVIDHRQRVLADSNRLLIGQTLTTTQLFSLASAQPGFQPAPQPGPPPPVQPPLPRGQVRIISTDAPNVTLGDAPLMLFDRSSQDGFSSAMDRSVWLAIAVAALVALIVTLILSNTILGPIHALTLAARRMERGDLRQRVAISQRDEIGELAHAFNTMADSLERSEQLRRSLVSDVAHELRTPLTNIRGYLEALQDQVTEPTPATIASLYEESLLLSRLVTDLQDLTQAEAGQLRLVRMPVSLEDIILKATQSLRLQAEERQITLSTRLPPELPLVDADPERVGQVLRNLLTNALTYTPPGGRISIGVEATTSQRVEVRVEDTGVGIAAEHLPHLFKRFYRADRSRTRATGGSGLGLAIVEQLVHAHGGQMHVRSQEGRGTCFTFTLPTAAT
jgi:signal transduction histidine kinase